MDKMIAYCGLDCGKCDAYIATVNDDQALREKTAKLWSELNHVAILPEHINCEGCRTDGVKTVFCQSLCKIRQCAMKKGFNTCGDCHDMQDCQTVAMIHDTNPSARETARSLGKLEALRASLRELGSAVVAFSAGVDSTFLLHVAHEVLGDCVVAVTLRAPFVSSREIDEAVIFCRQTGVKHVVLDASLADIPAFAENPPDRCYHCKKALLGRMLDFARGNGLAAVLEGSNLDDDGDYRPGRRAICELGVRSPLYEVGLTKAEIRALSREMGLPAADKPSFACLASRFPYGERITAEGLDRVGRGEEWLRNTFPDLGQLRVRCHGGTVARIEVAPADIPHLASRAADISAALRDIGFTYVSLDLRGYRTGSLNETLPSR